MKMSICYSYKFFLCAEFGNGKFCKDPKLATANDFFLSGLNIPKNTVDVLGSNVDLLNVDNIPDFNTLGVFLVRIDFAPYGLNPPYSHPHATEVFLVFKLGV
jgi:hypothetical protein